MPDSGWHCTGNPRFVFIASLAVCMLTACRRDVETAQLPAASRPSVVLSVHSENNGPLWLVQMETVANELQLAPDQRETFANWSREANLQSNRLFAGFRTGEDSGTDAERAEAHRKSEQLVKGFHQQVIDALDARQVQRLEELFLQSLGPRLFFFPPLLEHLKITEPQQLALREAVQQDDRSYESLLEVLTTDQRAELERLQGEPFDFPTPRFINFEAE